MPFWYLHEPTEKNLTTIDECACPHQTWILECNVRALSPGSSVVWNGSAFDRKNSNDTIVLLPRPSSTGVCNDGSIVAHSFRVDTDTSNTTYNYTSRLNVRISPSIAGKYITCSFDNGTRVSLIGSIIVTQKGKSLFTICA